MNLPSLTRSTLPGDCRSARTVARTTPCKLNLWNGILKSPTLAEVFE
jgi:hypothetical protein